MPSWAAAGQTDCVLNRPGRARPWTILTHSADSSHLAAVIRQLTADSWHLTADNWKLTSDSWTNCYQILKELAECWGRLMLMLLLQILAVMTSISIMFSVVSIVYNKWQQAGPSGLLRLLQILAVMASTTIRVSVVSIVYSTQDHTGFWGFSIF